MYYTKNVKINGSIVLGLSYVVVLLPECGVRYGRALGVRKQVPDFLYESILE